MKRVVLITCIAVLAACNKSPQVNEKNATVAEVAEKVRAAGADSTFVNPGQWQSKVTIDEFDVPGMPPEMAGRMKQQMAKFQERSFETCLTPDQVKRPKEDFFTGNKSKDCRYDHFTMGGGKIDALMRCTREHGATQVMAMTGTYSPESYDMHMAMSSEGGQPGAGGMNMKMHVVSNRIGECTAKERTGQ